MNKTSFLSDVYTMQYLPVICKVTSVERGLCRMQCVSLRIRILTFTMTSNQIVFSLPLPNQSVSLLFLLPLPNRIFFFHFQYIDGEFQHDYSNRYQHHPLHIRRYSNGIFNNPENRMWLDETNQQPDRQTNF